MTKPIGKLHKPETMFLRHHVGEAKHGRKKYDMSASMGMCPIVHSGQTGKWFSLSWEDILKLAVAAGIDKK